MDLKELFNDALENTKCSRFDYEFDPGFGIVIRTNYGVEISLSNQSNEITIVGKSPMVVYSVAEYMSKLLGNMTEMKSEKDIDGEGSYAIEMKAEELEITPSLIYSLAGAKLRIYEYFVGDILPEVRDLSIEDQISVANSLGQLM